MKRKTRTRSAKATDETGLDDKPAAGRPIWSGAISFGLLNIPVQLMSAERHTDLQFHMLDRRDEQRVRYERVNAATGKEVPWKEVVKAFEYSKGNYVVLKDEDLSAAAPRSKESVDIEAFVDMADVSRRYFERPYFLVPGRKAEKGYVLLRETLRENGKAGLARVVIRTREYLALVAVEDRALVLFLLRYPEELIDAQHYKLPEGSLRDYRIAPRELEMAKQLVSSMAANWNPDEYKDEFRGRLSKVIESRMKKGRKRSSGQASEPAAPAPASGKVVDFMSLLKKSIAENRRTPAAGTAPPKTKARTTAKRKARKGDKAAPAQSGARRRSRRAA
ncbi:MAG TPA: Ku protein [Fontimonas sp.]